MRGRIPLFISGDLHAIGETRISATNRIDLTRNPVISVLSGPLGTAGYGWPSFFRGTRGMTPGGLAVYEVLPTIEENGFLIADLHRTISPCGSSSGATTQQRLSTPCNRFGRRSSGAAEGRVRGIIS